MHTWQVALSLVGSANPGQVEVRFQSLANNSTTNNGAMVVGFTPGLNAHDRGTRDISSAAPFSTDIDRLPLLLTASPAPTQQRAADHEVLSHGGRNLVPRDGRGLRAAAVAPSACGSQPRTVTHLHRVFPAPTTLPTPDIPLAPPAGI